MRKILVVGIIFGSSILGLGAAEAIAATPASAAAADPQIRVQIGPGGRKGRRWNRPHMNRGARTYVTTRIVGNGRNRYRETIRVTVLPNGRTMTQVISRVRVR
ncbi:MAG: hypothetical protein KF736_05475 [Acidobacteria bacterium]|nr:hypothetical protein [Acidobacteriota bacterium]MCW5948594.1 hypothetical protein [Pyrinomonadaceae bacterium]